MRSNRDVIAFHLRRLVPIRPTLVGSHQHGEMLETCCQQFEQYCPSDTVWGHEHQIIHEDSATLLQRWCREKACSYLAWHHCYPASSIDPVE